MKSKVSFFTLGLIIGFCFFSASSQSIQSEVSLTARLIEFDENQLKIEFNLNNQSDDDIYVATNPTSVNGKNEYYLLADQNDASLLKVSSRVYDRPPYFPYMDSRRVELKKLNFGEKLTQTVTINFPAEESDPPHYGKGSSRRRFNLSEIRKIELTIGYFIEKASIVAFLKTKPFGWLITGQEVFKSGSYKNQSFLEIQKLASTLIEKTETN